MNSDLEDSKGEREGKKEREREREGERERGGRQRDKVGDEQRLRTISQCCYVGLSKKRDQNAMHCGGQRSCRGPLGWSRCQVALKFPIFYQIR